MADRTFAPKLHPGPGGDAEELADHTERRTYVFDDHVVLAVNVALAADRPLLVFGPPGSGKSSLARDVARELGWRYYEQVITSRTEAADLLWHTDLVRRLADAQAEERSEDEADYRAAGALWWAFEPDTAKVMGARVSDRGDHDPDQTGERAVVLLDEIDKADPDLPNNLLVPLGSWRFAGPEGPVCSAPGAAPLVVITSNNERDLPQAFLRRCVICNLPRPSPQHLVEVAVAHFGGTEDDPLYAEAARLVAADGGRRTERAPSTAEYLDFIRACRTLQVEIGSADWRRIESAVLLKEPNPGGEPRG